MHNKIYNTRAMVEAGLTGSLIVIMMLFTIYIPVFSIVGVFILPIPVTVLYIRQNLKITLGAIVVSGIFIAIFYSPISAVTMSLMLGSTGITLGYSIKNKKSTWFTFTLLAIVSVGVTILDTTIYTSLIAKGGFMSVINNQINSTKDSMTSIIEMYKAAGMEESQINQLKESMKIFTADFLLQLIPASLIIMGFTSAWINYSLTKVVLKKLGYKTEPIPPFSNLYLNNRIGTVLLIIMIIGILLKKNNILAGGYIFNSLQFILQMVLLVDGIAMFVYLLKKKLKLNKVLILLIIFLTATSPTLSYYFVFGGLLDMIFDFRKLDPFRRKKAQ